MSYTEYSIKKIINNIVAGDIVGTITASGMQSFNHDNCWLIIEPSTNLTIKSEEKENV